jgi:hypothetical protein
LQLNPGCLRKASPNLPISETVLFEAPWRNRRRKKKRGDEGKGIEETKESHRTYITLEPYG